MDRQALVEEHLALVRHIASKVCTTVPSRADYDDLVAFGQQGLIQAARRYDPERGVAFSSFAYYRIRGAIFDGLRKMTAPEMPSRRALFNEHANTYLNQVASETPAPTAGAAAERLASALADLAVVFVVSSERIDDAEDETIPSPAEVAERKEQLSALREGISCLPDKERRLLELMYYQGLGLVEAGQKLEMSKGWASRLHARAVTRLRKALDGKEEDRAPPTQAIKV